MSIENVDIVTLQPVRVASAWGFGAGPEDIAWQKLEAWAAPLGLLRAPDARVFGFNNPNPSVGSPNYGYEFMVTVGPEIEPGPDIRIGELKGGKYAVMAARVDTNPGDDIPAAWRRLDKWVAEHGHRMGHHQWLEEMNGDGQLIALWYAVQ
jgi:DNA gyrase inhibitor GyrI